MSQPAQVPGHARYHPRWYRRRMPIFWWLGHFAYTKFIVRELTSLAVAYSGIALLAIFWAVARGGEAYGRLLERLATPPVVAFHTVVLLALLLHSVTWLNLTPKALVVQVRGKRLPDSMVAAAHYVAWLAMSGVALWLLLGG